MRDTLDRWLTGLSVLLILCAAAIRRAHRASVRRRLRKQNGAYWL
jgi:hypothetical protein